jgi:hypothetical protein
VVLYSRDCGPLDCRGPSSTNSESMECIAGNGTEKKDEPPTSAFSKITVFDDGEDLGRVKKACPEKDVRMRLQAS